MTAAMAAAAGAAVPGLRRPLLVYVAIVGITRVTFGAHFPFDVVVGAVLGYEIGLFSAALVAKTALLPARAARAGPKLWWRAAEESGPSS